MDRTKCSSFVPKLQMFILPLMICQFHPLGKTKFSTQQSLALQQLCDWQKTVRKLTLILQEFPINKKGISVSAVVGVTNGLEILHHLANPELSKEMLYTIDLAVVHEEYYLGMVNGEPSMVFFILICAERCTERRSQ